MRRVLIGLLTLGACAWKSVALAGDAALDDFLAPPLRATLEPQDEISYDAPPRHPAAARRVAPLNGARDASGLFDRANFLEEPVLARPSELGVANPDSIDATVWAKPPNNIFGRDPAGNIPFGYRALVEAAGLQGWFGVVAAQAYVWRLDQENRRPGGAFGYRTGWAFDYAPTPGTMLFLKGYASSLFQRTLVEIKPGYALSDDLPFPVFPFGKIYIGPFAVASGDWRDKLSKVGAHVTVADIGVFSFTLAGGYASDRYLGSGAFGLIELSMRF